MCIGLHVKYPLFLSDFNETGIFLDKCSNNTEILNFIKILPREVELFHSERQTDRHDEANSRYSQFSEGA